jgi:hypothetical protein
MVLNLLRVDVNLSNDGSRERGDCRIVLVVSGIDCRSHASGPVTVGYTPVQYDIVVVIWGFGKTKTMGLFSYAVMLFETSFRAGELPMVGADGLKVVVALVVGVMTLVKVVVPAQVPLLRLLDIELLLFILCLDEGGNVKDVLVLCDDGSDNVGLAASGAKILNIDTRKKEGSASFADGCAFDKEEMTDRIVASRGEFKGTELMVMGVEGALMGYLVGRSTSSAANPSFWVACGMNGFVPVISDMVEVLRASSGCTLLGEVASEMPNNSGVDMLGTFGAITFLVAPLDSLIIE